MTTIQMKNAHHSLLILAILIAGIAAITFGIMDFWGARQPLSLFQEELGPHYDHAELTKMLVSVVGGALNPHDIR